MFALLAFALSAPAAAPVPQSSGVETPISGDAQAGLVSRTDKGEVHLIVDPVLNDHRLVLRVVVLNRSDAPQPLGPASVHVDSDRGAVAIATAQDLSGGERKRGPGGGSRQAYANPGLPTNAAGQKDVTGFTGSMGSAVGGVPNGEIDRAQSDDAAPNPVVAALLKPTTLAPGAADGGLLLTEPLKRGRYKRVTVTVDFAGEAHRFTVDVPR
ncbi:hypothetical protein [Stakelama marina]|uniref:Copper chaperone PCu(A)C n=1 Tax=Stakelama marina TaxID=2826939 RepID=A0A8T4IEB2_9SPHN|nr:hypothetical protein [Stakelama marina]MBR0552791.1 hypothetical protein [Stakelama marina]